MVESSHEIKQEVANEQLRLTLAIAIIATAIGVFTLDTEKYVFAETLQWFALLPSLLMGFYMIFTAALLKYKRPAEIGDLSVPEKARRGCYDLGVNLFWTMFLIFVFIFFASLFGWSGDMKEVFDFWPSFIISFAALLILVLISAFVYEGERTRASTKKRKLSLPWRRR